MKRPNQNSFYSHPNNKERAGLSKGLPFPVLNGYLRSRLDPNVAQRHLESGGLQGLVWAGEIALEQAYKRSDLPSLESAQAYFQKAIHLGHFVSGVNNHENRYLLAQSEVLLNHLPVAAGISLAHKLPQKPIAQKVYSKTVTIGHDLAAVLSPVDRTTESSGLSRVAGLTSELAVLLLLERAALKIGPDSWFPLLSFISEDKRNGSGSLINHGWDINVFADNQSQSGLDVVYRTQIKSSDRTPNKHQFNEEGISIVRLDPDLRISNNERHIGKLIIDEVYKEEIFRGNSQRITAALDYRTELLLNCLDKSESVLV